MTEQADAPRPPGSVRPSGSIGSDDQAPPSHAGGPGARRSRRQPVLVALVALLSLGGAGGAAYELAARTPAAGTSVGQRAAGRDAGTDGPAAGRPADGGDHDGHRGRRSADGASS